jgi:ATP-dependent Clp protease protease subunit
MSGARTPRIFARVEEKAGQKRGALHLYDAVGGWDGIRAKHVVEKLEALKVEGAEHLDVHINSPGGDVFEGMAIHTAIASWPKGEKRVHVDGLAASIASIVAMAGDEIEISPTAMVMVHEPRGFAMGEAADLRKMADRLDSIRDVMCDVYAARTGLAKAEVEKLVAEETWMSAAEAVKKGFADKIADPDEGEDEDEEEDDQEEEEDEPEEDSVARAVAQFKHAPPDLERLLDLPLPNTSHSKEPQMPEPIAAVETKAFEARFAALTERAEAAEKIQGELLAITGKATAGEALALVAGLKEKATKADELARQLAGFEAEKRASQVAALLDAASREGRLTPAKREELMKADAPAFARDPAQLKVFLDCLQPVVVPAAAPKHEEPKEDPQAALTEDEKHFAEQLKVDPKKVAELKTKKK